MEQLPDIPKAASIIIYRLNFYGFMGVNKHIKKVYCSGVAKLVTLNATVVGFRSGNKV